MFQQKAERRRAFLKAAITGPSGSGKTYSALRLAFGLGERVALIDTENESGSLYADLGKDGIGDYYAEPISAPFSTDKYIRLIRGAVEAKCDVLIIDSISHAWAGSGGLLEQKEALDLRGGGDRNKFANWGQITKLHEAFKSEILQAPLHVIATMRSKTEYEQKDGKVQKLGMAPIQRDGMDYEFTVVFDIAQDHGAMASKDRTGLFPGLIGLLTNQHGRQIREWLESGTPALPAEPRPAPAPVPESSGDRRASGDQSAPVGDLVCAGEGCGKTLTAGQASISQRSFNKPLCPGCQKVAQKGA